MQKLETMVNRMVTSVKDIALRQEAAEKKQDEKWNLLESGKNGNNFHIHCNVNASFYNNHLLKVIVIAFWQTKSFFACAYVNAYACVHSLCVCMHV